ncbi:hypothetical protein PATA110616_08440 [Paenibacillus tarimensis]
MIATTLKSVRALYKPQNRKINFLLLNGLAVLVSLVLWIREYIFNGFDIAFPIVPYIFLSLFCAVVSLCGINGYYACYYYGFFCFIMYTYYLWETIDTRMMGMDTFILTLLLYPFTLPPFPALTPLITFAIDVIWRGRRKHRT